MTLLLPSHGQLLLRLLKGRLMSFHTTNMAKRAPEFNSSLFELPNKITGVDHSHNGIWDNGIEQIWTASNRRIT